MKIKQTENINNNRNKNEINYVSKNKYKKQNDKINEKILQNNNESNK